MKVSNHLNYKLSAAVVGCLALGLNCASAAAAAATASFTVTATVQATCTVTAGNMGFGTYVSTAASATSSTITVTCTSGTPYTLGLDPGLTSGATVTTRQMAGPSGALLPYALYQDSGHTINWGNTTGSWVAGSGNGAGQALTVYGQVAAGQYVAPGAYTDTITATVTY